MKNRLIPAFGMLAAFALAGCVEGLTPFNGDPNTVIATGVDTGRDPGLLVNGEAAIAYDPDGCQNWIIDDGVEGYASPRFDPVSGLPICNDAFPPGTVIRDHQTGTAGITDRVPGPGRKTVVVKR
jgi:hypothetical protein